VRRWSERAKKSIHKPFRNFHNSSRYSQTPAEKTTLAKSIFRKIHSGGKNFSREKTND
jgi:hypothetical protein